MRPECFWMGGMWIFPMIMLVVILIVVYLVFKKGNITPPWCGSNRYNSIQEDSESALDILKKRYARGEISKDEFEQIRKDIS